MVESKLSFSLLAVPGVFGLAAALASCLRRGPTSTK